ncbi:MAG: hypothetical protein ACJAT4_001279 [Granulosicoccus sp.]|jgi:hypothetical protein
MGNKSWFFNLINSIENPLIIIFPNPFYWKNRNTRRLGKISIV